MIFTFLWDIWGNIFYIWHGDAFVEVSKNDFNARQNIVDIFLKLIKWVFCEMF